MKKSLLMATVLLFFGSAVLTAQVTVGANSVPNATLDVVGQATDATVVDGVIAPRVTLTQLKAKDAVYTAAQDGVIVYVADTTGATPAGKTVNVKAPGYYYFDGAAATPVWKGFGGGAAATIPKVSKLHLTSSNNTFDADYFSERHTVIVHWGTGVGNLTIADLNSTTDVGKMLTIVNRGSAGTIQADLTVIKQTDGTPELSVIPAAVGLGRARTLMWIEMAWIEIGA